MQIISCNLLRDLIAKSYYRKDIHQTTNTNGIQKYYFELVNFNFRAT